MDRKRELDKFKLELIMTKPFFGNVLYSLEFMEDSDMEELVKAEGIRIKYNPKLLNSRKIAVSKLRYMLLHEVYHVLLLHDYRMESRDSRIWSVVCDMVVEFRLYNIMESEFGKLNPPPYYDPGLGLYLSRFFVFDEERFKRESEERLYRKLMDSFEQSGGEIEYSDTVFSISLKRSDIEKMRKTVMHTGEDKASRNRSAVERIIAESVTKDRMAGNVSSEGVEIFGRIEGRRVDWKRIMRRHLQVRFSEESSFAYPDARFHWNEMVIPGYEPIHDQLNLLVILDLSSSIDRGDIGEMLFQIKSFSEQFELSGRVIGFSTEVVMDSPMHMDDIVRNIEKYDFGGTDWNCVPKYIYEKQIKYGFAVTITDGNLYSKPVDMADHMWIITPGSKMNYNVINKVIEL